MSDNIISAIIGAVSGSVFTVIGSFIVPYVNWGIEKRRDRMNRQRDLITSTRSAFAGIILSRKDIQQEPSYGAIRAHLSQELINNIERSNTSGGEEAIQKRMMQELSELEKKWELI